MKRSYRPFRKTVRNILGTAHAVRRVNVLTKIIPVHFRRCFRIVEVGGEKIAERLHRRTVGVRTNYGAVMMDAVP